jgi:hypothetical protein
MKGRRFTPHAYDGQWGKTVPPQRTENGSSNGTAQVNGAPAAAADD